MEKLDQHNTDILIAGGGTAGAALAGIIARDTDLSVLLLEAGPDYGPCDAEMWPADLLDATLFPETHGWGYTGSNHPTHRETSAYDRARVIGGCSSHNGCVAVGGHRRDYDRWAELGNTGWSWEEVAPAFARAKTQLRVHIPPDEVVTPYHQAFMDGAVAAGIPRVADLDDPDDVSGTGVSPVNIAGTTRWNTAFAYLDPMRDKGSLTIVGNALVDRVILEGGKAVAVEAIVDGQPIRFTAQRIVLAAGAYGSPAILMRSGIGNPDDLRRIGIASSHELPGVGAALTDHPLTSMQLEPTPKLVREMEQFSNDHWMPDEQTILKTQSPRCAEAFDLHIYGIIHRAEDGDGWRYSIPSSTVSVASSGSIQLVSADPEAAPIIDHGFLNDPEGIDLAIMTDGLEIGREIAAWMEREGLVSGEILPGREVNTRKALERWATETVRINYHPACSCRMGPATDPLAVVDSRGNVHGIEGLFICDASIFPTLMRANTNLPAAMVAEHLAATISSNIS